MLDTFVGRVRASLPWQVSANVLAEALGTLRKRNFLILSSARCGSNLLVDYVNAHWRVICHREILNDKYVIYGCTSHMPNWRKRLHIKSFFLKSPRAFVRLPRQFVGFKALHDQFESYGIELSTIIRDLSIRHIVCLYREDLLDAFVSLKIAEKNDCWYSTDQVNTQSVIIDQDEFVAYCKEHRRLWAECAAQISDSCGQLFLSYESLVNEPSRQLKRVFEFLGPRLNRCPVAKSVKQNPRPISEKVSNYRTLSAAGSACEVMRYFDLPQFLNLDPR